LTRRVSGDDCGEHVDVAENDGDDGDDEAAWEWEWEGDGTSSRMQVLGP
jgi:hypothetical protein